MDSKPSDTDMRSQNLILRDISERDLPGVNALLTVSESFIRPTITPASLTLGSLCLIGAFHGTKGLIGIGIRQDFGIRSLLSDILVITEYASGNVALSLGRMLIQRAQRKGSGRMLALAGNDEQETRLKTLGFEPQRGEYYLRRQLPVIDPVPAALSVALSPNLSLETHSLSLIPEALELWSTEPDMHLPPWEDLALLRSVVTSHGILHGVRESTTGQLVGTLLASIQGEDAMLYHLYIAPHYRRRGVGSYLAKATLKALEERGCSSALLCVHDERAFAFWESFGFTARRSDRLFQLDVATRVS